jgi:hypothetical protein
MVSCVNIEIVLQSYFYNHWPELKILLNDKLLFDDPVVEKQILTFDVDCKSTNQLEFIHYNKQFGKNNVWDTDPVTGADCKLQILDIKFDQVSIGKKLKAELEFVAQHQDQSVSIINTSNGWMTYNGFIKLNFETPIYNWLIINKFKLEEKENKAFYSNFTKRWHYEQDIAVLDEIRKIMEFDENCCDSRTKT